MKLAIDGLGIPPAEDIIKAGNNAYPFTSALTIVDIGCGSGQVTNEVLKAHGSELPDTARLVAFDLSPETLEFDAQDLSVFSDNLVSHALANFVLFIVPQSRAALKEIHRILTSSLGDGVVAVSSWQGSEWQDLISFVSKVLPDKATPMIPPTWSIIECLRGQLELGNFREIEFYTVKSFMPLGDHEELARFILTRFPGIARMTNDMTTEELSSVHDLMVEHLKQMHPITAARLAGTAIIGMSRK